MIMVGLALWQCAVVDARNNRLVGFSMLTPVTLLQVLIFKLMVGRMQADVKTSSPRLCKFPR